MNEQDALESDIRFGAEVRQFLTSSIGRYLLRESKKEIDGALEEFKTVDPDDSKTIRELQCVVKRNESVEMWLSEAIQKANDARDLLEGIE